SSSSSHYPVSSSRPNTNTGPAVFCFPTTIYPNLLLCADSGLYDTAVTKGNFKSPLLLPDSIALIFLLLGWLTACRLFGIEGRTYVPSCTFAACLALRS
ncbi:hypothetical protein COCVIDRAFT_96394, partial [Bipolaris victoriae FI3]